MTSNEEIKQLKTELEQLTDRIGKLEQKSSDIGVETIKHFEDIPFYPLLKTSVIQGDTTISKGYFQSPNFVSGSTGWRIDSDGNIEANSGTFRGSLAAATGTIGGFNIGSDYIRDVANSFGLASTVTGGDDVRFWAGDTFANRATAPFRVTEAGVVTAANITITGGSVLSSLLSGPINTANLNIADRGWSQTCAFSVTDADTIAWGAGTFTSADGTAYSISAGNTGNMSAKTYIYLDTAISTTAYQTTTTATTAVGGGKVLIAIAENGTTEATYQVMQGQGGQNIDAANIVAGSITANEIAASTITAGKLSITQLSAITANMGSITAGNITLDTSGYIRGGQTDYLTGTGFFLGYSGGAYKFSLGVSTGNYLTWDGSVLTIGGKINMVAGDILYASADTTRTYGGGGIGVWAQSVKKHTIGRGGTYRIKFDAWLSSADTGAARIYKNGSGVGTTRTLNTTPTTFSEDISGWSSNDEIQLWYSGDTNINLDNFRLYVLDFDGVTTVD